MPNRRWWILTLSICTSRGFGNSMLPHTRKRPKNNNASSFWSIWRLLCWSWSHRCLVADIAFVVTIKLSSPTGNGNHTNMQHPAQITKHLQCKKQCVSLRIDRCYANHIFALFSNAILIFCIAAIQFPHKKPENLIPMLGGKRTSKTRQENDRPNKQRKVQS